MRVGTPPSQGGAGEEERERLAGLLASAMGLDAGQAPFPWQVELLQRMLQGRIERTLDLPTGLGKTAVMAIWLVARVLGAPVPRRLVYVVDRRAVVDQATEVAQALRRWVQATPDAQVALGLVDRPLPISTLRGQFADNREWLEDPAAPAIIVGTIDMIGSRLLFEGYGTTRKMRPYHAALLASDVLLVLDEAHLVPPFEALIDTIAQRDGLDAAAPEDRELVPGLALMALSATARTSGRPAFTLTARDVEDDEVVARRLRAPKRLTVVDLDAGASLPKALAAHAWALADAGHAPVRVLVYCDRREHAVAAHAELARLANEHRKQHTDRADIALALFVGSRRVYERQRAADELRDLGLIAGSEVDRTRPVFVVATSAGEVGVDLDADHMVCDLVAWERMVQRLGRVNRRGERAAKVIVLAAPDEATRDALDKPAGKRSAPEDALAEVFQARRALLDRLPEAEDAAREASPLALLQLKRQASSEADLEALIQRATSPIPLRPALTRPLLEAWAMTSLSEHTGRPEVAPWLRGWVTEEPQTAVAWRRHLPPLGQGRRPLVQPRAFFEAAPVHLTERLETETFRVAEWLLKRLKRLARVADAHTHRAGDQPPAWPQPDDLVLFVVDPAGEVTAARTRQALEDEDKNRLVRDFAGQTLVLDVRFGGLAHGLLDPAAEEPVPTLDGAWIDAPDQPRDRVVPYRVRMAPGDEEAVRDPSWRERLRIPFAHTADGDVAQWLIVDKIRHDAATEEDRSSGRPQTLAEHASWTEARARALAERLALPADYARVLAVAARLHDEGKRATRWQRAFRAPGDPTRPEHVPYAKTLGPVDVQLLDGYRHEFGSLPMAQADPELAALPSDLRDLALHLIAAHHGFARPTIGTRGCEDQPPSALLERAREVADRFARLQRRWGPWGLAWWESLLRAADQQASRDNDLNLDGVQR